MNIIAKTALRSVWSLQRGDYGCPSVAISVFVLLSVEHIRSNVKQHFSRSTTGVDLIVGPRTGDTNLLLYSVFNVGYPTHTLRQELCCFVQAPEQIGRPDCPR